MSNPLNFVVLDNNITTINNVLEYLSTIETFPMGDPKPILKCQHCGYNAYLYAVLPEHNSDIGNSLSDAQRRGNFIWEPEEINLDDRVISWEERIVVGALLEISIKQGFDVTIEVVEYEEYDDFDNEISVSYIEVALYQNDKLLYLFTMNRQTVKCSYYDGSFYMQTTDIPCLTLACTTNTKEYLGHLLELRDKLVTTKL